MKDAPNYYAVIPASVRYDEELSPNAKLLYGEITALSSREGFCWATNRYFAELYKVNVSTVSEWVAKLFERGHVKVELVSKTKRRIIVVDPSGKAEGTLREKPKGVSGKAEGSSAPSISINNTSTEKKKAPDPETEALELLLKSLEERGAAEAWGLWCRYRRRRGLTMNPMTLKKHVETLLSYPDPVAAVSNAIEKGWQFPYPMKGGNGEAIQTTRGRRSFDSRDVEAGADALRRRTSSES